MLTNLRIGESLDLFVLGVDVLYYKSSPFSEKINRDIKLNEIDGYTGRKFINGYCGTALKVYFATKEQQFFYAILQSLQQEFPVERLAGREKYALTLKENWVPCERRYSFIPSEQNIRVKKISDVKFEFYFVTPTEEVLIMTYNLLASNNIKYGYTSTKKDVWQQYMLDCHIYYDGQTGKISNTVEEDKSFIDRTVQLYQKYVGDENKLKYNNKVPTAAGRAIALYNIEKIFNIDLS